MKVTLLIPVFNEAAVVRLVLEELRARVAELPGEWEVLVVDDGSTDGTGEVLAGLPVRVLRHDRNSGKLAALLSGMAEADGDWLICMDGDGQDDPAALPAMLEKLTAERLDLLLVRREGRAPGLRHLLSRLISRGLSWLGGGGSHEWSASMLAFSKNFYYKRGKDILLTQYMQALQGQSPWKLGFLDWRHRPRLGGRSKFGLGEYLRTLMHFIPPILVVFTRRRSKP